MDDERLPDELAAAHPVLRAVAPPDAPYPGALRRTGVDRVALFVDAAVFGGSAAWACDPHGHVLAPLDVARRRDGHDVIVAHCVERLDDLIVRRSAGPPLADGEIVTLAVSLRRGLAELLATGTDPDAAWWLTDDGRPVLACVSDGEPATHATAAVLTALQKHASFGLADALDGLADAVSHPRALTRDADLIEAALFAAATPVAVDRTPAVRSSLSGLLPARLPAAAPAPSRWDELLRGHLDGDLADLASAAVRSVGQGWAGRWRGRPPRARSHDRPRAAPSGASSGGGRRTMPVLVAGCVGAAVIAAGLLWPSGDEATAEGVHGVSTASSPSSAPTRDAAASASHAPADPDDPVAAAADLLTRAAPCGDDLACVAPLVEDPASATAERLTTVAADSGPPEIVDSFGGAAVVRVAHDGSSSLVVVVRTSAGWRVRDVYDVADPP